MHLVSRAGGVRGKAQKEFWRNEFPEGHLWWSLNAALKHITKTKSISKKFSNKKWNCPGTIQTIRKTLKRPTYFTTEFKEGITFGISNKHCAHFILDTMTTLSRLYVLMQVCFLTVLMYPVIFLLFMSMSSFCAICGSCFLVHTFETDVRCTITFLASVYPHI